MLDEESLDPRAPSYRRGRGRRRARRLRARVPRRDDRRLSRHRGARPPTRSSRRSVGSRRASWCSGAATTDSALAELVRAGLPAAAAGARSRRRPRGRAAARVRRRRSMPRLLERLPRAAAAAAAVLRYAGATQPGAELPLARLELYARTDTLIIDEQARAPPRAHGVAAGSPARRLAHRGARRDADRDGRAAAAPLAALPVGRRSARSAAATTRSSGWSAPTPPAIGPASCSATIADIERLVGRARLGVATPRDLAVLGRSLARAARRSAAALAEAHAGEIGGALAGEADLLRLRAATATTTMIWPPSSRRSSRACCAPTRRRSPRTAATSTPGVSAELDELATSPPAGRSRIAAIEARERERTGIPSLKIKFNNVFGYYIEVTRSHLGVGPGRLPAQADRRQRRALRHRRARRVRADRCSPPTSGGSRSSWSSSPRCARRSPATAERLLGARRRASPTADALAALAEVAHRGGYCRPEVDDGGVIDLARRAPPGGRAAGGGRQLRPQRRPPRSGRRADPDRQRPQHGRQVDADPAGGAGGHPGADGRLRGGARRAHRPVRPDLHPRRRRRQPGARRVDVHGRDARDRADPPLRDRRAA